VRSGVLTGNDTGGAAQVAAENEKLIYCKAYLLPLGVLVLIQFEF